jgi:uncharacterized membrane protein
MGLSFCNNYSFTPGHVIYLAIMWRDENSCRNVGIDDYNTIGWYDLQPGACREIIGGDLRNGGRYYGFYAELYNRATVWNGNISSWVSDSAFRQCHGVQCTPCRVVGFQLLDVSGYSNYSMVLHA